MALLEKALAKMGPVKAGPAPSALPDESEDAGGGSRAAEDFLAAVKGSDAPGLLSAFERLMQHCQGESSTEEE